MGEEVINYINRLTPEEKENIFLLTDFELLEQGINGLEVVARTMIRRSILVTSYSSAPEVQDKVCTAGIKMLPKELAYAAQIIVDKKIQKWSNRVDMVWVEDQEWLVNDLVLRYYNQLKVDIYYDPTSFMQDVHQYPLDTRIILDSCYEHPNGKPYTETGYDLAKELHAIGYKKLIIYTGEDPKGNVPEYLIVARKKDQHVTENLDKI
ncbi:MAG: hypothetical protein K0R49_642, partial [Burkholderiales bacterium]|nr:hypothetical protein [Burkholderiales bacterium]